MKTTEKLSLVAAGVCAVGAVLLAALPKDWIEGRFGVEPDGGSGFVELVPIVVLVAATVALTVRVVRARWRPDASTADVT